MIDIHNVTFVSEFAPNQTMRREVWIDGMRVKGVTHITIDADLESMTKVTITMLANVKAIDEQAESGE